MQIALASIDNLHSKMTIHEKDHIKYFCRNKNDLKHDEKFHNEIQLTLTNIRAVYYS
jgi:hypothetical protein